ncbi:MAG: glycerol-3-phosphate 1-O-acyltransferase PlsY [Alphaproteobacteria bacterium]|jgi:acyl phosphate:glycerol-3-phosphate acyltransferase|nr:glycerol-3-phosphate 1-O-acyltransferase PlsY [Alphaproteobacteria bacterium]MBT5827985.1 glycerol-3-phosphate 1-O-acyltransferase PlsY [Alphaproteobacteria bacterium]
MLTSTFALILLAYFIGSIPFGLIITKFLVKKDIRTIGSGNIGATNVVRAGGKKLGALTLFLDALKGLLCIALAHKFNINNLLFINLIALFAVLGHCFPVWLKFKGGKGVATYLGILLILDPILTLFIMLGWYVVFYITYIVSFASVLVVITIILFLIMQLTVTNIPLIIASIIIIYRHKENISRMLKGKESSFKK